MGKTAFIFPGQGAQYIGMAKDFYDAYQASRACFLSASEELGFDIGKICFEDEEKLWQTEYTQPAMLTAMAAMLAAVKETGLRADMTAGLSLGEYGALLAAGVSDFRDTVRLVRKRGILMQNAYPEGGSMSAVIGLSAEAVEDVCRNTEGLVAAANYNCPGQLVISGEKDAVSSASEQLMLKGAKKIAPLKVSGPFHTVLLKPAGEALADTLKNIVFHQPENAFVSNVTAGFIKSPEEIKELLSRQVYSPVLWQQSVEAMINEGADTFIEIGPGRTLASCIKRISRDVKTVCIGKISDLENLMK